MTNPQIHMDSTPRTVKISKEKAIIGLIILLAFATRFISLGQRVLSHDEGIHLYYSHLFAKGMGYAHNPLSHGPLQFHLIAFLFFIFGESDFIGRIPHALASVLSICMLWKWRIFLGRNGAVIAALLMLTSPFMLYYGRYARNESFIILFGILMLYAILMYLETRKDRYIFLLTLSTALHFTSKETAFIYTAQALLGLAGIFFLNITNSPWKKPEKRSLFLDLLGLGTLLLFFGIGLGVIANNGFIITMKPEVQLASRCTTLIATLILFISSIILFIGYGWHKILAENSFTLLAILSSFVLPHLSAFPAKWLGWNPLEYHFTWHTEKLNTFFNQDPIKTGLVLVILFLFSAIIGFTIIGKRWIIYAILFWSIYTILYTSFFSHPQGFFTGVVGSLGYWLEQQAVRRGNQPWFYYIFFQIPIYEFLPFTGVIPATIFGIRGRLPSPIKSHEGEADQNNVSKKLVFPLLAWWLISSLLAFSLAGEKMPWLTIHPLLPAILLAGWGIGLTVESSNKKPSQGAESIHITILLSIITISLGMILISNFSILWVYLTLGSLIGAFWLYVRQKFKKTHFFSNWTLIIFLLLFLLTAHISFRATFQNAEEGREYLVYAHGSSGIRVILQNIEKITQRTIGNYDSITILYDGGGLTQGVSWPMKWYLRNYSGARPFFLIDNTILQADIIIADPQSFSELDLLTADNYIKFETIRMVWPNQDYFNLSWDQIREFVVDKDFRNAIISIWYSRDYSLYASIVQKPGFTSPEWNPGDRMRLYVRKDILQKVWEYDLLEYAPE